MKILAKRTEQKIFRLKISSLKKYDNILNEQLVQLHNLNCDSLLKKIFDGSILLKFVLIPTNSRGRFKFFFYGFASYMQV